VSNECWAKTGKDILLVSNNACVAALVKLHSDDAKTEEIAANSWVSTCWLILTKSLHDDILLKVAHVERGHIETLLKEIAASLVVHTLDEVGPLRLELYAASMLKDCNSDLQAYIAYLQMRQRKLAFLKKPVAEDELVAIFIKGLHPLFQPLQVHLAIVKPVKWDEAVEIVRQFASSPVMVAELNKLKSSGLSQHVFNLTTPPASTFSSTVPQLCPRKIWCQLSLQSHDCTEWQYSNSSAKQLPEWLKSQPQSALRFLHEQGTFGHRLPPQASSGPTRCCLRFYNWGDNLTRTSCSFFGTCANTEYFS